MMFLMDLVDSKGYLYMRADFPSNFVFGAGTTAYQVEGAANEDGRTPSIWDTFVHAGYSQGATGDITCDQYHKYKEDVQLMVDTGLEGCRFSISWSRLIPNGRGPVNPKGVAYYNNLINELISHGIQSHVTLTNYDIPQALEDEYGGWIDRKIIKDFTAYADTCFREFGDRVSHWTTVNEPNVFSVGGYDQGFVPPTHCSAPFGRFNCTRGNSSSEPYLVVHNVLLSHASAASLYKKQYQSVQHGLIGIGMFAFGFYPLTDSEEDLIAVQRAKDFFTGWIAHPMIYGDYPTVMKKIVGSRLPSFTDEESQSVKGSSDFIGFIHYFATYVKDKSSTWDMEVRDFYRDMGVELRIRFGLIQPPIDPEGLEEALEYFKEAYGNHPVYIYENGAELRRNSSLEDTIRVKYLKVYIQSVLNALRNGSDVRGYFVWSFLDVLELLDGLVSGFGLYYVDLDDPHLTRYPKLSQRWYSQFLKGGSVDSVGVIELETKTNLISDYREFNDFNLKKEKREEEEMFVEGRFDRGCGKKDVKEIWRVSGAKQDTCSKEERKHERITREECKGLNGQIEKKSTGLALHVEECFVTNQKLEELKTQILNAIDGLVHKMNRKDNLVINEKEVGSITKTHLRTYYELDETINKITGTGEFVDERKEVDLIVKTLLVWNSILFRTNKSMVNRAKRTESVQLKGSLGQMLKTVKDKVHVFVSQDKDVNVLIKVGNGEMILVEWKGSVELATKTGNSKLDNVYYTPQLDQNLISVGQLMDIHYSVVFENTECKIFNGKGELVHKGAFAAHTLKELTNLWHKRFGHAGVDTIVSMQKRETMSGIQKLCTKNKEVCGGCEREKIVFSYFKQWRAQAQAECGEKVRNIRSDRGGEYISNEMKEFMEKRVSFIKRLWDLHLNRMELLKERIEH
ncbi:beta-glucosidase 11-like [Rutidosis leptorrhynchoides]|uniref:beta-glucosidase 11-like n=1 Tax=Rutidosis leptorrhynchoides TaxID=125765 RepID=UPI003A996E75